ncbi:MAG: DegV family protein [Bacillota bacterium]
MAEKIQLVTDSTADLPGELVGELGVTVVPLNVTLEGETFLDGSRTPEEFLEMMKGAKELPRTSQPSPGDFVDTCKPLMERGPVLCITMSSKLSGTAQSASVAAQMLGDRVVVFDSLSATLAEGAQVVRAAELADEGLTIEEVVAELTRYRDEHRALVAVSDLTNLVKGGRLPKWQGKLADLMKIRPLLHNVEGAIEPLEKIRGIEHMFQRVVERVRDETENIGQRIVGISHAGNPEWARWLEDQIRPLGPKRIISGDMGCVISTHAGPGAIIVGV